MKKMLIVFAVCLVLLIFAFNCFCGFVKIGKFETVTATFRYGNVDICQKMTEEDAKEIYKIFNKKFMTKDIPSCGFSEHISVTFDDSLTFCIARDTCPTVLLKEKGKCFSITSREQKKLFEILSNYQFSFPCV